MYPVDLMNYVYSTSSSSDNSSLCVIPCFDEIRDMLFHMNLKSWHTDCAPYGKVSWSVKTSSLRVPVTK